MANYEFSDVSDERVWTRIVENSPTGWFWSSWTMHQFRLEYARSVGKLRADLSFVVLKDGEPRGLAPFVLIGDSSDNLEARHLDSPLPWPMAVADDEQEFDDIEGAMLDEIERRSKEQGAGSLSLLMGLPEEPTARCSMRFIKAIRQRRFVDESYHSHFLHLDEGALSRVRERYRRDVRKFRGKYDLQILHGQSVPDSLSETYMDLHTRDSGRKSRPLATYDLQVRLAQRDEAFWVVAKHVESNRIVGMLLVSYYKGAAYDNSVAVDPDFEQEHVSHVLKWHAIEHLLGAGAKSYELGTASSSPTFLQQPSDKNYGISFFKEGWSRGGLKTVHAAKKFYTIEALSKFWSERELALAEYFGISERSEPDVRQAVSRLLNCGPDELAATTELSGHPAFSELVNLIEDQYEVRLPSTQLVTFRDVCEAVYGPTGTHEVH